MFQWIMAEKQSKKKNFFRSILYGEFIPITVLRRYSGVLLLVLLFFMGYIANNYI